MKRRADLPIGPPDAFYDWVKLDLEHFAAKHLRLASDKLR
jgi:hypothetical protein